MRVVERNSIGHEVEVDSTIGSTPQQVEGHRGLNYAEVDFARRRVAAQRGSAWNCGDIGEGAKPRMVEGRGKAGGGGSGRGSWREGWVNFAREGVKLDRQWRENREEDGRWSTGAVASILEGEERGWLGDWEDVVGWLG